MNETKILDNAINDLKIEYQKALKEKYIFNPIACALYKTWKKYNNDKYRRNI